MSPKRLDEILDKLDGEERKYLEQLLYEDPLTAVYNRGKFDDDIQKEVRFSKRADYDICLVMFDIDFFKQYNDREGHQQGDVMLRVVAQLAKTALKSFDSVYRYGGEEFGVLLRDVDLERGLRIAERIRYEVEEGTSGHATVSVGAATYKGSDCNGYEDLISYADRALYQAKNEGRNCIRSYTPPPSKPLCRIDLKKMRHKP
jgi:diguanylate cyclase (GGDEF)-like protein